ncbi:MAG: AAA family ATPase, partial [Candidatus Obscuribacterales bacterium]|nr:AAA family ATPase [Candidatus Obscuribacterales bacterium]
MNETWWVDPSNLDSDQLGVIDLSIDEHQMLSGPPGSGKTNLLLLKGNQFVYAGRENIRFVVFTRALREFISGGSQKYEFDNAKVKTINGWMMEFLSSEKVKFDLQNDFPKDRALLIRLCKEHIERKKYKGVYNAIIVDEGQDCLPDEIQLFHKLADTLLVATDDRQRLYGGAAAMNAWFDVIPEKQRYPLSYHYRNGKKICQVADAITPVEDSFKLLPFCKYDEVKNPSKVNV